MTVKIAAQTDRMMPTFRNGRNIHQTAVEQDDWLSPYLSDTHLPDENTWSAQVRYLLLKVILRSKQAETGIKCRYNNSVSARAGKNFSSKEDQNRCR